MLGPEDHADLRESGLRGAVPAPHFVRLDGCVGYEVDDPSVREKGGSESWMSASGANTFASYTLRRSSAGIARKVERARAEQAGVVDEEIDRRAR